jgi:non-ribosomal peptide synthetase component F
LQLLADVERQQLLVDWNDTATERSSSACVHQQFEHHAETEPDAIAVLCGESVLTYGELNRRANALAHHLRRLGVGPETVVGICVERSLEMMTGVLGILKAGGAYMPLDPHYPQERLSFILQDCGAPVLVTQKSLLEKLPPHYQGTTICLDENSELAGFEETENPPSDVDGDNLAYVIYTSGSTGRAKGVAVSHNALLTSSPGISQPSRSQLQIALRYWQA